MRHLFRNLSLILAPALLLLAGCGVGRVTADSSNATFSITPGTSEVDTNCTGCNATNSQGKSVEQLTATLTGGGPANVSQLITTWSYNLSFQQFSFGEGAALNNVLLVLALICSPLYLLLSRGSLRRSSGEGK